MSMTVDAMRAFGVEAEHTPDMTRLTGAYKHLTRRPTVVVEGDWSSASYPLAAGALAGEARVTGLNHASSQARQGDNHHTLADGRRGEGVQ